MKKLILAITLSVLSSNLMADWTEYSADDNVKWYVDADTILKKGDLRKAWVVANYQIPQNFPGTPPQTYKSSKDNVEIDCNNHTMKITYYFVYEGAMGQGMVVSQFPGLNTKPDSVSLGTRASALLNIVCAN